MIRIPRNVPSHGFSAEPAEERFQVSARAPETALVTVGAVKLAAPTETSLGPPATAEPAAEAAWVYGTAVDPWSKYFHFPTGTKFDVDGPGPYNGVGSVIENADSVLKFDIHMPEAEILGVTLPKIDLLVEVTYVKEGAGNKAVLKMNGTAITDSNLTITSSGTTRTIKPSVSIPNHTLSWMKVSPDGKDEVDFDVLIDGREVDFDLER